MVLDQQLLSAGSDVEWHGIGTDISFGAIASARAGVYGARQIQGVPLPCRRAYLQQSGDDQYRVTDAIRDRVNFFHSNLLHIGSAPFAMFDVVFCQNVLIYFDRATRLAILDELFARTRSQGLLILGAGEDIGWSTNGAERIAQRGVTAFKKLEV
jgi:chemotaxis methyl-accepting protein methylase